MNIYIYVNEPGKWGQKVASPKKPVARVSGAKIMVTTAKRCMMMFMTYPCKHTLRNRRMVGWYGEPHLFRHAEIDHGKAAVL
jgi:hypothetical protein